MDFLRAQIHAARRVEQVILLERAGGVVPEAGIAQLGGEFVLRDQLPARADFGDHGV